MLSRTALVATLAFGCATAAVQAAGIKDNEIVVGSHLDLSGPVAAGMPQLRNGMQMRFDEANDKGGIHGRKFRFIVEDNASQPQVAVRATEKLINSDGVFAILNPFGSGTNAAAVKRAVDAGVIYFSPWGASAVLQKISGNSPLLFTTIANYDTTTGAGLKWMIDEVKPKKIGFIFQEGPFGDLLGAGVKAAVEAKSMTLAATAGYKVGDIDFSSQVARMQAAGVDLIVTATIIRETVGVAAEIKKLGMSGVKMFTGTPGRTNLVAALGKDNVEGIYGVGTWNPLVPSRASPEVQTWAASFKSRYNLEPDETGLLAYAYTDWFVNALQAAGRELTADKMAASLRATSGSNPIFYDTKRFVNNHAMPESVKVEQIKGGAWTAVSPLFNDK
jgi:ABC-type branched-subunit amino acid transport system substrate-binding protein